MKKAITLCLCGLTILTAFSCKKNNNNCDESNLKEGYIIGFDQCTAGKQSYEGKGFVIVTNNFKDTLVTYNLPDSLYKFPPSHFANKQFSFLFPDSVRSKYKIHLAYRSSDTSEYVYPLCTHDILEADFGRFVKGQIEILCIRK